jgi:hypothetical protein
MDYLSILTFKAIGKIPSNFIINDNGFDIINQEINIAIGDILKKYSLEFKQLEIMSHDLSIQHIKQCDTCKTWIINRTKEKDRNDVDNIIKNGAEFEDKILCSDCLPINHKWSCNNI